MDKKIKVFKQLDNFLEMCERDLANIQEGRKCFVLIPFSSFFQVIK